MTGRQKIDLYINLGLVVPKITLNIMLIPRCGLGGAAIATLVSSVGVHSVRLMVVKRVLGVHPFDGRLIMLGVVTAAVLVFAYLWAGVLAPGMAILYPLGMLLVLGLFLLRLGLDELDRDLIRRGTSRLLHRQAAKGAGAAYGAPRRDEPLKWGRQ